MRRHRGSEHPQDFMYLDRQLPSERHRRACGLGAGALSEGCARAGLLRWNGAVRTCRSAQGRASRLGNAHLQLRPKRGPHVPDLERGVLAEEVSHRRVACGRRCLDAVPRLLTQGRRVGSEQYGGNENLEAISLVCARSTKSRIQVGRRDHDCGGIDRVPRRVEADVSERARLHDEVEHGVDA